MLFIRLINSAVHSPDLHAALERMDTFVRDCGSGVLAAGEDREVFDLMLYAFHVRKHVEIIEKY